MKIAIQFLYIALYLPLSTITDLDKLLSGRLNHVITSLSLSHLVARACDQPATECPEMVVLFFSASGNRIAAEVCSKSSIIDASKAWQRKVIKGQVICILKNNMIYKWKSLQPNR
jgi:hypothetical protein